MAISSSSRTLQQEAIMAYGSVDALFVEQPTEAALSAATEHFKGWLDPVGESVEELRRVVALARVGTRHRIDSAGDLPEEFRVALIEAIPWPKDLAGVLTEHRQWKLLVEYRRAFDPHYEPQPWVHFREALLELDLLDGWPASSWDDLEARLIWWNELVRERGGLQQHEARMQQRLAVDVAHLRFITGDGSEE